MSDDDMSQVNHLVPSHVKEAAKNSSEHGELSEEVRSLYRRIGFGEELDERETLKMELERTREKKDNIRAEIRDLQAELRSTEAKETRLEEKVSGHESDEQRYIGHLESLESRLYDGVNLDVKDGGVGRAAKAAKCEPEEVIEELKERNPEIPDHAFSQIVHSDKEWAGVEGEVLE